MWPNFEFILICIFIVIASSVFFYYIQYIHTDGYLSTILVIICILLAGSFGGLLCSIQLKDRMIKFPSKKDHGIDLGIISDILFGIGGGFLVFLILPEFPKVKESWGVVKLLSLSIVGGYSWRALINKVANEQIINKVANEHIELKSEQVEMKSWFEEIRETENANERACKMFSEIIEGNDYKREEIEKSLKGVSQTVAIKGFEVLNNRRRELALKLIEVSNLSIERDKFEEKIKSIKEQFDPLIILLEEIIKKEEGYGGMKDLASFLHYHYASLSYIYKDKIVPDWSVALKYIDHAIELHGKSHEKKDIPDVYLLNKLLCHINLSDEDNSVSCFEKMWKSNGGRYEIIRSEPVLAPKLHDWIRNSRYNDDVAKYAETTLNKVPCKVDWWSKKCICSVNNL